MTNKNAQLAQNQNQTQDQSTASILQTLAKKFSSRKFILSFTGVIVGIVGMIGCSDDTIAIIAFIALEILSIIGYLIVEGKVDAAAVKAGLDIAQEIADVLNKYKKDGTVDIPENSTGDKLLETLPEESDAEK